MPLGFVFPGQGSQFVGMGAGLAEASPAAREVFEEVDEALGEKLSALMFGGEMETLSLTANTQPALMAHSIAVVRCLEKEAGVRVGEAAFVAGHSLGEYAALCAAGALSLAETARLLRRRGAAMQAAVPAGEGAMAALLGADIEKTEAAIAATPGEGVLEIANDNAPGQVVVSGAKTRVEALAENARGHGIKMAKLLPVSAPFHCSLMAPAAEVMAEALAAADLASPRPGLVANITAEPVETPDEIRDLLVRQVTGRVRWRESVERMAGEGVDEFVELGAGKVLSGLGRRIAPDAAHVSIGGPDDIEAFLKR